MIYCKQAIRPVLLSLLFLLSFRPAAAAPLPDAALSLSAAVETALRQNPDIRRAANELMAADANLRVAGISSGLSAGGSAALLSGTGDALSAVIFGKWERRYSDGSRTEVELAPIAVGDGASSASVTYRKPLFRGSGALSPLAVSRTNAASDLLISEQKLFQARQNVLSDVVAAYFRAFLAAEEIRIQERSLAIVSEAAEGAAKRAEAGLVAEIEVSRAEIRVARTKDDLNRKVQAARAAMDQLMAAMGSGPGASPALTTVLPEKMAAVPDQEWAMKAALTNSIQLKIYDQRLQDMKLDVALSEDKLKPSLDAVAGYGSGGTGSSFLNDGSFSAGLQFSVLLDRRILQEERASTLREQVLLQDLREFEVNRVAADVRTALRAQESAANSLGILGKNLAIAQENLRLAQRMVEEGLSSNREVLDAQESLITVETGLLAARVNYYLAGVNLRKAMSEDLLKMVLP